MIKNNAKKLKINLLNLKINYLEINMLYHLKIILWTLKISIVLHSIKFMLFSNTHREHLMIKSIKGDYFAEDLHRLNYGQYSQVAL
jgi:hypothetical protein